MKTLLLIVQILLLIVLVLPFWLLIGNWFPIAIAGLLIGCIGWDVYRMARHPRA